MVDIEEKIDVESMLKGYNKIIADIKMLEKYPIGIGMSFTPTNDDDLLQDLHKLLREMPTYMYLSTSEQEIERVANEYMYEHPYGMKSQLRKVGSINTLDEDDEKRLNQLKQRIKTVIEARRGVMSEKHYSDVLNRLCKLQELQDLKELIDTTMSALDAYQPNYARLLKLRYFEGMTIDEVIVKMSISSRTFDRWKVKAIEQFTVFLEMA